ncbi:MAG: AAA family ATPase [Candidatus Aenigmarchaeota archaeon]|nr:AAA family ATPase [Candidatus Aenigmarchaeota archaeon]
MAETKRTKTGITGLDALIEGGFPEDSIVVVSGTPGTGKTIMGLQFLYEGAKNGEMGIYVSFEQEKKDIFRQAAQFGWDFAALEKKNMIRVFAMWPSSFDEVMSKIFKCLYYKPKRLVVDSITSIAYTMGSNKNREAFHKMAEKLKDTNLTSILISEMLSGQDGFTRDGISEFVGDGLILMKSVEAAGEHRNILRVEKMRSSMVNKESHIYQVARNGIELTSPPVVK